MSSLTAIALASLASAAASFGIVWSRFSRSARRAAICAVSAAWSRRYCSNFWSENVTFRVSTTALCSSAIGTPVWLVQNVLPFSRWPAQM
jgi:hypothetical protein